jgi:hypothetical protein
LVEDILIERQEPTYAQLVEAFDKTGAWLAEKAESDLSFDGGGLVFAFSGHGRLGDGTLVLRDSTYFSADDFLEQASRVHRTTGSVRPIRVVLLLDSCYSGAFLARVAYRIRSEPGLGLDTEYMLASSHPDEVSWEAASLSHGLSTFCFSLREAAIGADIGVAGLGGIKTWSSFAGPNGCSIATGAAQNPIVYQHDNVETCFQRIEDTTWKTQEELLQVLKAVRDDLYDRFELIRRLKSDLSDRDIEASMAEQLALVREGSTGAWSEDRAEALLAFRRAWWLRPPS